MTDNKLTAESTFEEDPKEQVSAAAEDDYEVEVSAVSEFKSFLDQWDTVDEGNITGGDEGNTTTDTKVPSGLFTRLSCCIECSA